MHHLGQLSPPQWRTAMHTARWQQAEHLRQCLAQLSFNSTGNVGRWITLLAASLASAGMVAPYGHHIAIFMVVIAVASLVSSIAGFAFSAIGGAMLFHLSDNPVQVVQVMITCSIANQAAMTWASRHDIVWRQLSVYLAGGALGLLVGVWLLFHANHAHYAHALGLFLLAYGLYMFMRKPMVIRRQYTVVDFATGFLGGITGGAAGFPSAFVTIWCGMKGWDKTRQRAVFQPFILIMQVATLLAISLWPRTGVASTGFYMTSLLFIPASLLGTSLGLSLYRRLTDSQFARAVNVLLIVSGVSYVM